MKRNVLMSLSLLLLLPLAACDRAAPEATADSTSAAPAASDAKPSAAAEAAAAAANSGALPASDPNAQAATPTPNAAADAAVDAVAQAAGGSTLTPGVDYVEIQGNAEHKPFSQQDLNRMLAVARQGIHKILAGQKKILGDLDR